MLSEHAERAGAPVLVADRGPQADVLVVDDDELIRDVLSEALAATGYGVRTAANGRDALERVGEAIPDLIVSDVLMPDLDGPAVLGRIRERPETSRMPVIFLTAKTQAADRRRFEGMGVSGTIAKPFDPTVLGRVGLLERAADELAAGGGSLRAEAELEAHRLAGSLGTFGFGEGSRLALEYEEVLQRPGPLSGAETERLRSIAAEIRRELTLGG